MPQGMLCCGECNSPARKNILHNYAVGHIYCVGCTRADITTAGTAGTTAVIAGTAVTAWPAEGYPQKGVRSRKFLLTKGTVAPYITHNPSSTRNTSSTRNPSSTRNTSSTRDTSSTRYQSIDGDITYKNISHRHLEWGGAGALLLCCCGRAATTLQGCGCVRACVCMRARACVCMRACVCGPVHAQTHAVALQRYSATAL